MRGPGAVVVGAGGRHDFPLMFAEYNHVVRIPRAIKRMDFLTGAVSCFLLIERAAFNDFFNTFGRAREMLIAKKIANLIKSY